MKRTEYEAPTEPSKRPTGSRRRVTLVCGDAIDTACSQFPLTPRKVAMSHSLILAMGLNKGDNAVRTVAAIPATETQLREFHSQGYVKALLGTAEIDEETAEEYGFVDDCPLFGGIGPYCTLVAGASLQAAAELVAGRADVAINWAGGRHHATPDTASGFCYVNDVVLAAMAMSDAFGSVLCVDVDIHHGDGTQEAFLYSGEVSTLSFHRRAPGFFPGTGSISETGSGDGKGRKVNVPISGHISDSAYSDAFRRVFDASVAAFNPGALVVVFGTDGVAGDSVGCWGLSSTCLVECVEYSMCRCGVPTLLLGGGGYVESTAARCYAACTARAIGRSVADDEGVPEHEYFPQYGPDFTLKVPAQDERCAMSKEESEALEATVSAVVKRLKTFAETHRR